MMKVPKTPDNPIFFLLDLVPEGVDVSMAKRRVYRFVTKDGKEILCHGWNKAFRYAKSSKD